MSQTDKSNWIDALRSGKYKQGKPYLNINNTEFSCLGVLCELQLKTESLHKEMDKGTKLVYYDLYVCGLPEKLIDKFSIQFNYSIMDKLLGMNDRLNGFNEIAEYIELNVEVI